MSKSHGNTSMYVDTVINFANYHIHTHTMCTYYVHTTYRISSDHIVSGETTTKEIPILLHTYNVSAKKQISVAVHLPYNNINVCMKRKISVTL